MKSIFLKLLEKRTLCEDQPKLDQPSWPELFDKTKNSQPNMTYLNEKFRDYYFVKTNIKNFAYEISRREGVKLEAGIANVLSPGETRLVSSACKQKDLESDWFLFWCKKLKIRPTYHRKIWEFCYILQVLHEAKKIFPGSIGIGFGCGEEPIPSLLASRDVKVLATDLSLEAAKEKGWIQTNQHLSRYLERYEELNLCQEAQIKNIDFMECDMNNIPHSVRSGKFDFCWSACALEHLGNLENGLKFIERSLECLKPGGVAIHTTEWNFSSDEETIDNWETVLFLRKHFLALKDRLDTSYKMRDLDFDLGDGVLDGYIDIPPYPGDLSSKNICASIMNAPHLKLSVDGFGCTSFGVIIEKI